MLTPIFAVIGMIISAGLYHLIAKLFHGSGKWGDLAFCLSAVVAPSTIIAGVVNAITLVFLKVPVLSIISTIFVVIVSLILGIYVIVLNVNAIKAAENLGTGQALATLFIPGIIAVVLSLCVVLALIPAFQVRQ
jgi:hypothetical protein